MHHITAIIITCMATFGAAAPTAFPGRCINCPCRHYCVWGMLSKEADNAGIVERRVPRESYEDTYQGPVYQAASQAAAVEKRSPKEQFVDTYQGPVYQAESQAAPRNNLLTPTPDLCIVRKHPPRSPSRNESLRRSLWQPTQSRWNETVRQNLKQSEVGWQ